MHWAESAIGTEGRRQCRFTSSLSARRTWSGSVDALAETATKISRQWRKGRHDRDLGLRNLAYRIQKNRKAHYVALEFDAPTPVVAELERQTQISEDVIRYVTIKVDAHEEGPSVMMRRGDRDKRRDERGDRDRGDRGDRGGRGRDEFDA